MKPKIVVAIVVTCLVTAFAVAFAIVLSGESASTGPQAQTAIVHVQHSKSGCKSVADQAKQLRVGCRWYLAHAGTEVPVRVTGGYVVGASAGVIVLAVEVGYGQCAKQQTVTLHHNKKLTKWKVISIT